jgi:predicted RecA/RadA family phage recombinase
MKNLVQDGKTIQYTVTGADVKSGAIVVVGDIAGIAVTDGKIGDTIALEVKGVYNLPKVTGVIAQGKKVYAVAADGTVTTTATSNTFIGYAWTAAASGDTTVDVKLSF